MPVPSAVISVPISWLPSMRSNRARSTFRILPFSGRIAWNLRSRPCLADPPALSPSTMKISHLAGSRSWQSASLPGSVEMSSTPLRRVSSRALRAASRAAAASITFWMMPLASFGCVSNQCDTASATAACTTGCTSDDDQLVLGLRGKFRVRHLHRQHRGHALAHVLADQFQASPSCPCSGRISSPRGSAPGGSRPDASRRRAAGCCW